MAEIVLNLSFLMYELNSTRLLLGRDRTDRIYLVKQQTNTNLRNYKIAGNLVILYLDLYSDKFSTAIN